MAEFTIYIFICLFLSINLVTYCFIRHIGTGLPTKDETSETTVRNLYCPCSFTCFFLCKLIKYAFLKTKFKAEVSLWSSWVSGRLYSLILCGYYYLFPWLVRGAVQNWDFFITNTNTTHKPCIRIIFSSGIHCINVVWRRYITAYTCVFVGANSRDPKRIYEIWKFR